MDYNDYRIVRLIQRDLLGGLTNEEREELERWIGNAARNARFYREVKDSQEIGARFAIYDKERKEQLLRRFEKRIGHKRSRRVGRRVLKYAAVVMLPLICVCIGVKLLEKEQKADVAIVSGILQGGVEIALSSDGNQELMEKTGGRIINSGGGIMYSRDSGVIGKQEYNVLRTERGGEYSVELSDGTRVKINAATSLRYPVTFDREKREVYLSGEAYFEVEKDTDRPFYVVTDAMRIRVYGTSFNVNTYGEKVQTVLVKGRIGIQGKNSSWEYEVNPSELAEFGRDGKFVGIRKVDTEMYTGWKDGVLIFENESLEHIMNVLALWYDVDVVFQNPELKQYNFGGYLKKYENIDVILDAISRIVGVTFVVKDKTVTVQKQETGNDCSISCVIDRT